MTDPRYTAGVLAGRREMLEHVVPQVRRAAAGFRAEEAKRGRIKAALLWATTEMWLARFEAIAAGLEQQVAQVRAQESQLQQAPPAPPAPPKGKAKPKGKRRR